MYSSEKRGTLGGAPKAFESAATIRIADRTSAVGTRNDFTPRRLADGPAVQKQNNSRISKTEPCSPWLGELSITHKWSPSQRQRRAPYQPGPAAQEYAQ